MYFEMIYGIFLQSLPFWYLISRNRKSPFSVFCRFRDLQELKRLGDIYSVNILSREAPGALELHERSHEAQRSMVLQKALNMKLVLFIF
jgi:hypothetical protein